MLNLNNESLDLNENLFLPIFLEAESCNKLLQSNPQTTNGTYQIAVGSEIFLVSDFFKVFNSLTVS